MRPFLLRGYRHRARAGEKIVTCALIRALLALPGAVVTAEMATAQEPAYALDTGPAVLIDAAHHNVDGAEGRASLTRWLREDGYRVRDLLDPFDRESLEGTQIVIIKNALSEKNAFLSPGPTEAELREAWRLPVPSAFSPAEIEVLREWITRGGALLLVIDHMPMPGAAQELAGAFGIETSNGFAVEGQSLGDYTSGEVAKSGSFVFRRMDGSFAEDPITDGGSSTERVDSVATYSGSAFRLPAEGRSLFTLGPSTISLLPEVAWEFSESTLRMAVGGWSQGGVLRVGEGRIAVFGDGAILVTPDMVADEDEEGPNPALQNPRLLLNVLRWLSGLLDGGGRAVSGGDLP